MAPQQRCVFHDVLQAARASVVSIRMGCTDPTARHPGHVIKNGAVTRPQVEGSYQTVGSSEPCDTIIGCSTNSVSHHAGQPGRAASPDDVVQTSCFCRPTL